MGNFTSQKPIDPILIVDDDILVLKALEITLKREGYNVISANNGTSALEILKTTPISLIICDEGMPDIHGMEVLKFSQEKQPLAVRIILTGKLDLETTLNAINVGRVDEFITKPWEDLLLKKSVFKAIEKYKLQDENIRLFQLTQDQHKALSKSHQELKKELKFGSRIHQELLQGKIPSTISGLEVAATTVPSKDIDGDFYDFFRPLQMFLILFLEMSWGKGFLLRLWEQQ